MDATANRLLFGPAGWSYADWKGRVYPQRTPRDFHPLPYLARCVDLVEVNATFYAPMSPRVTGSWLARLEDFRGFRFSLKAWERFTHGREGLPSAAEARGWGEAAEPLREAGRLVAILVQFPFSFRHGAAAEERLLRVRELLPPVRLAAEFRHLSWGEPEALAFLGRHGFSFVNIDQPRLPGNLPPTAHATSALGYVRLHGRNAQAWWKAERGGHERYDYRYGPAEVAEWAERIRGLRSRTAETLVVGNNHFQGKGLAVVLELAHALTGERVAVPEPMLEHFPELAPIRRPGPGELFA